MPLQHNFSVTPQTQTEPARAPGAERCSPRLYSWGSAAADSCLYGNLSVWDVTQPVSLGPTHVTCPETSWVSLHPGHPHPAPSAFPQMLSAASSSSTPSNQAAFVSPAAHPAAADEAISGTSVGRGPMSRSHGHGRPGQACCTLKAGRKIATSPPRG